MYCHHTLSKNATDNAIASWKHGRWSNDLVSTDVYQTVAAQTFPSPDSMLYDPTNNRSVAFEFKPPTETKRGILTGVGQSIAYLSKSSISYLMAPSQLEGYNLSEYLKSLFEDTIFGKLPVGLIIYRDDEAKEIKILVDIDKDIELKAASPNVRIGRYWAKHVDMPLHALWLILDYAYLIPSNVDNRIEFIWNEFWNQYLFPRKHRLTLKVFPTKIVKHDGTPLYILDRIKRKLQKEVMVHTISNADALLIIADKVDPDKSGDNYYKSYKKNFLPFIKHLKLWDDNGHLTEDGLQLHRIGKIHGPTGQTFKNYFGSILLFNGKHLDLILDVEKLTRNQGFDNSEEATNHIQSVLIENGLYKPSPGKVTSGTASFLKYERIIWGQLGLLDKVSRSQYVPKRGFAFNWEKITRLCSLD